MAWRFVAGACVFLSLAMPAAGGTHAVATTPETPTRQCFSPSPEEANALRAGRQRLVVSVTGFQPGNRSRGRFAVFLLTGSQTRRDEIARFALHPPKAFAHTDASGAHYFQIGLQDIADRIADGKPFCVEVAFDPAEGEPPETRADISIELSPAQEWRP